MSKSDKLARAGGDCEPKQSQGKDCGTVQSPPPPTVSISFAADNNNADSNSILDDFGSKESDGGEGSGSEFSSRVGDNEGSEISTVPDKYGFLGGQQYKAYPDNKKLDPRSISQLLNREKKWMEMIRQWDLNMQKNYKKVRSRCRKGIPRKIRPLAWHYLCGGQLLMGKPDTGCYAEFLSRLVQGYTIQGVTLSSCPGKGIPSIWQTFKRILTDSSSMRCS
uniref:TBC1 domain family member 10B n=1 Tax=Cacopsylla melanoneura TaxID=428564 RepID=A0A8D9A0X1_9HEMI